jgi:uroporphyrinogen-III synthase
MTPTLIVTRPIAQSESFAASVVAAWDGPLDVIVSPLIQIVPVQVTLPEVDAVIFTSANGVNAARSLGLPAGLRAWCVGDKTGQVAQDAGFDPIAGPGDADGLVAQLVMDQPTGTIAHIRGAHARGDVCARLNAAGLHCIDVIAYDQQPRRLSPQAHAALCGNKPVIFPLFSPRTSTILHQQGPFAAPVHVVALSEAVKNAVDPALGWDITVVSTPNADAMKHATLAALRRCVGPV